MKPPEPTMTPAEVAAWEEMARTGRLYEFARISTRSPYGRRELTRYHQVLAELAKLAKEAAQ